MLSLRKELLKEIVEDIADYGRSRKFKGTRGDRQTIDFYVAQIEKSMESCPAEEPVAEEPLAVARKQESYCINDVWYREDGSEIGVQLRLTEILDD